MGASSQGSHDHWGHQLETKPSPTIRFFYQNISHIPQDLEGDMKLSLAHHWLQQIKADVFAFMEAGNCWDYCNLSEVNKTELINLCAIFIYNQ